MSDLNSILKNLDWEHRRPFGWGSSPDADWKVIFLGTLILVALAASLSLLTFFQIEKGGFFGAEEEIIFEEPALDLEKLRKTLTYYQERAVEFRRLTSGEATIVVDPSL